MKIIVAPDSFKGSLTALEAAQAIAAGVHEYDPTIQTILLPAADGGEGTMDSLVRATEGKKFSVLVHDPLGRLLEASYGVLGDDETSVIEIAEASGLMRLLEKEKNPLFTSTYGTGEMIRHALGVGFRKFIIGLGGSATNDGGAGMLQALGMKLLDNKGKELSWGGGVLNNLYKIDCSNFDYRIAESNFLLACDVDNPLIGIEGASFIFGPQKGATPETVKQLDMNLNHFANCLEKLTGISYHHNKSAGAAGGMGAAFQAFFPGEIKKGIEVVLSAISFDKHLIDADLIITGEGKTDSQTLSGKTPYGIALAAQAVGKPVILISGSLDNNSLDSLKVVFDELHAVAEGTISKEESIVHAFDYLKSKTKNVIKDYCNRLIK